MAPAKTVTLPLWGRALVTDTRRNARDGFTCKRSNVDLSLLRRVPLPKMRYPRFKIQWTIRDSTRRRFRVNFWKIGANSFEIQRRVVIPTPCRDDYVLRRPVCRVT